jgi:uncharacterized DUF497 family protein
MNKSIEIEKCIGFDWDEGNILKNWEKHRVSASECEQIFFNRPLITAHDKKHSEEELRFTVREYLIRVISARNMNRKERERYEKS